MFDQKTANSIVCPFFDSAENASIFLAGSAVTTSSSSYFSFMQSSTYRFPFLMSKKIPGYTDLGPLFVAAIEETGRVPETIEHEGEAIPLRGLMTIAAIAKMLDDCDWLGGNGGNTGFVIKEDESGLYAITVFVDGKALTPVALNEIRPIAIKQGHHAIVAYLLEHDADTKLQDKDGYNLVHIVASMNDVTLLASLDHADPTLKNEGDNCGNTAAMTAARAGHTQIVDYLTEAKCNLSRKNTKGEPLLHIAVEVDCRLMLQTLLLQQRINLNAKNKNGDTALHIAVRDWHPNAIQALLTRGARLDVINHQNETPLQLAVNYAIKRNQDSWETIIMLLLSVDKINTSVYKLLQQHLTELKKGLTDYLEQLSDQDEKSDVIAHVREEEHLLNKLFTSSSTFSFTFFSKGKEKIPTPSTQCNAKFDQIFNL
jgi:ankyrin repeat protein